MRYTCTACDINTCSVRRVQCVQSLSQYTKLAQRASVCERACVRARRGLHRGHAVSAASSHTREMQRERVGSTRGSVAAIRVQRRTRPYSVNETAALLHNTQRSLLPYAARLIHATTPCRGSLQLYCNCRYAALATSPCRSPHAAYSLQRTARTILIQAALVLPHAVTLATSSCLRSVLTCLFAWGGVKRLAHYVVVVPRIRLEFVQHPVIPVAKERRK